MLCNPCLAKRLLPTINWSLSLLLGRTSNRHVEVLSVLLIAADTKHQSVSISWIWNYLCCQAVLAIRYSAHSCKQRIYYFWRTLFLGMWGFMRQHVIGIELIIEPGHFLSLYFVICGLKSIIKGNLGHSIDLSAEIQSWHAMFWSVRVVGFKGFLPEK